VATAAPRAQAPAGGCGPRPPADDGAPDGAGPDGGAPNSAGPGPQLTAQRDAPLGGQAVLEGVMMRGVANGAVAVRRPPGEGAPEALGEVEVTSFPLSSPLRRHRALRAPIVRGVVALGESLAIGFRALGISANAQLPVEEGAAREGTAQDDATRDGTAQDGSARDGAAQAGVAPAEEAAAPQAAPQEIPAALWAGTAVVSLVIAVGLFFLIPVGLTSLIKGSLGGSSVAFWAIEGTVRTAIFLGYMLALSRVRDLRRVFEYHGAEHKTISCYEAQLELTPANAQRFSRLHPRCGTSFLLVVMLVAIVVFAPLGLLPWYWLVATRILGIPLIAGISFEIIKFAGRNRRRGWVRALMWPGLKLQLLTTREPDLHQLAVAIAALRAVLAHETPGELSARDLVGVEVVA
jgi:uncharacterized protein YqhQ